MQLVVQGKSYSLRQLHSFSYCIRSTKYTLTQRTRRSRIFKEKHMEIGIMFLLLLMLNDVTLSFSASAAAIDLLN